MYLVSVLLACVSAVLAAAFSVSGFSAQVAFHLLATAWLYYLVQGHRTVRRGQVRGPGGVDRPSPKAGGAGRSGPALEGPSAARPRPWRGG
ncbi:hypothetical protein, partial [Streptomyces sp. NPDC003077]|uniref:hypothetical protein n=1 Tax=Streptomyces sp. NPDC003077 TaxID=3154443 RepID=UPI00339E6AED